MYAAVINFPEKLNLAHLPTPIEKLEWLSKELGLSVYMKRDDLTGSEVSGNKVRKLEFSLKEALTQNADVIITCGGIQSNHCRAAAAICAKLHLSCCLLLKNEEENPHLEGNYFMDKLLGAEIRFVSFDDYKNRRNEIMQEIAKEYEHKGKKAYVIPEGASNGIGTFGYLNCMREIEEQEKELGIYFDTIIDTVGSGGTFAGLYLSNLIFGKNRRFAGVNVSENSEFFQKRISEICTETGKYLGLHIKFDPQRIEIIDGYVGRGYALSRPEELEFLKVFARQEGIILDPVYTGKCMYGFYNEAKKGRFKDAENILFMHTGGIFGIFPKAEEFSL